jgi:RNA polymerase sigma factor (sigma-70 family)
MTFATISMPFSARELNPRSTMIRSSSQTPASSADAEACRLAGAVARGDEVAFRELYDRYHSRLYRLVVVLTRGDEAVAHNVVQSAMLTAAAKLKPAESEEHLWNWLARVARQHLVKSWRQQQREPTLVSLADLSESADVIEPDAVLEEGLDAALLALDEEDRKAVEWFYFDGLSHKEIAERLDATPKAVSSRLERARVKLHSLLTRILSHES